MGMPRTVNPFHYKEANGYLCASKMELTTQQAHSSCLNVYFWLQIPAALFKLTAIVCIDVGLLVSVAQVVLQSC